MSGDTCRSDGNGEPVGMRQLAEDAFQAQMREFCRETAPSRFALCDEEDDRDFSVFAWGIDFGDGALLVGEGIRGRFVSAETACRRFGARHRLHLVWVDPRPEPEADDDEFPDLPDLAALPARGQLDD